MAQEPARLQLETKIKSSIREIPDWPKAGVNFKDITPIFMDPDLCTEILSSFAENGPGEIDAIVGIESRGFLFGLALATRMRKPFALVRKSGKLPGKTVKYRYDLEYGLAEIEMHADALKPGMKVLIHDDLLATGGTAAAAASLLEQLGVKVAGFSFLVELSFLDGRKNLEPFHKDILALARY